jgi:uncharacterized protein
MGQIFAQHGGHPGNIGFNVDAVEAAMARVKDKGGQVIHGPMQVPGGSWIAHCLDPQGAIFAMVGPKG